MGLSTTSLPPEITRLRQLWRRFSLISLFLLLGGALFLGSAWESYYALRWLALSGPILAYLVVVFRMGLPYNHRPEEAHVLPTLGAGNLMTLGRGVLLAGLVGFLFSPRPLGWLAWIPGVLYTLACAADFLDGYLARRSNHATRLGEILDMSFDGVGVLAAATLAVQYGQAPTWYLVVGLARYLFLIGMWIRKISGQPNLPLVPSSARRVLAGLQMGFLAVILWPVMAPPASLFAATLFGVPFLIGFSLDWLTVSGVLQPTGTSRRFLDNATHWMVNNLPVLLRGGVLVVLIWVTLRYLQHPGLPEWLLVVQWFVALFVISGSAGRIFATAGLILIGIQQGFTPMQAEHYLLAAIYTALLFIGTGNYSLWKPEDHAVYRRPGERPAITGLEQSR
jgi:CDP-diacylglycerol--glycerol-3-phosphate 3-phosphatidyltransferase